MFGYAFTLRYVPSREDLGFNVNYDNKPTSSVWQ